MASRGVIMASKMNVYKHILNKKNSILIHSQSILNWKSNIEDFFMNEKKYDLLSKNSLIDVKKYTWNSRVEKILKFINV